MMGGASNLVFNRCEICAECGAPRSERLERKAFLPGIFGVIVSICLVIVTALGFIPIISPVLESRAYAAEPLRESEDAMTGELTGYTYTLPVSENSPLNRFFQLQAEVWNRENSTSLKLEPVPGRGGSLALTRARNAPRDGSALFAVAYPDFFLQDMIRKPYYRPDDIQCMIIYARSPMVLWVRDDGEFPDLYAFLDHVRDLQDPYMVAGDGSFTSYHLASLRFDRVSGSKSLYMPQLEEAEGIKAVIGKKALAWWGHPYSRDLVPGLKPLAVSGRSRVESLPNVPTFSEFGLDFVEETFFGLGVPAGSEPFEVDYIYEQFRYMLGMPDFKQLSLEMGFLPFETAPDDVAPFLDAQKLRSEQLKADYSWF